MVIQTAPTFSVFVVRQTAAAVIFPHWHSVCCYSEMLLFRLHAAPFLLWWCCCFSCCRWWRRCPGRLGVGTEELGSVCGAQWRR